MVTFIDVFNNFVNHFIGYIAVLTIGFLEYRAIEHNLNGVYFASSLAAIGAIIGYKVKEFKTERDKKII